MIRRPHARLPVQPCDTMPMCCTGECLQGRICPLRLAAAEAAAEREAREHEAADRAMEIRFWRQVTRACICVGVGAAVGALLARWLT